MSFINNLRRFLIAPNNSLLHKCLGGSYRAYSKEESSEVGGYAKAFDKFEELKETPKETPATFASLLRNSKFIDVNK